MGITLFLERFDPGIVKTCSNNKTIKVPTTLLPNEVSVSISFQSNRIPSDLVFNFSSYHYELAMEVFYIFIFLASFTYMFYCCTTETFTIIAVARLNLNNLQFAHLF